MSLCVGVISSRGAALATDSLRVDLSSAVPEVSTGFTKHVVVGNRAAGIVGASNFDEHLTTEWMRKALLASGTLGEIPRRLLEAGGRHWLDAFVRWRGRVGPDAAPEEFFTAVIVSTETGTGAGVLVSAAVVPHGLTFLGELSAVDGRSGVLAVGAVDDALYAHTQSGRMAQLAIRFGDRAGATLPAVAELADSLTSPQCAAVARELVGGAVARESALPRPSWWPPDVPVLGGPIASVAL